jgi:hypothetical protein
MISAFKSTSTKSAAIRFGNTLLGAASMVCVLVVVARIAIDPGNHIGPDLTWMLWLHTGTLIIGGMQCVMLRRFAGLPALLTLIGLLGVLLALGIDHFNLLVEHDEWCRRGMPSRWQVTGHPTR